VAAALVLSCICRAAARGKQGAPASGEGGRFPRLEKLCAFCLWCSAAVLVVTGFCFASLAGRLLSGYLLLLHTVTGGVFAVTLAGTAVLRGRANMCTCTGDAEAESCGCGRKVCFWVMASSGLALVLSILSAMVPLLGTHGQHLALEVHRYAALLFLLAAIFHAQLRG
jgi:hypothetical protein